MRRNKCRTSDKLRLVENRILNRIKNLYETGIQRFPKDYKFCFKFYGFAKQLKFPNAVMNAINFLISVSCIIVKLHYILLILLNRTIRKILILGAMLQNII